MTTDLPLLDQISIPLPCPVDWNSMKGNEQVRFCRQCRQRVYNLSEMTRADAKRFLESRLGALHSRGALETPHNESADNKSADLRTAATPGVCVRFYRRPDGTIVTRDCASLRRAARKTARLILTAVGAVVLLVLGCFGLAPKSEGSWDSGWTALTKSEPFRSLLGGRQFEVMGSVVVPSPPPSGGGSSTADSAP